ncbi:hypothetical protein CN154_15195 [Sinorhizobium meliloti]|uniref:hypothetical protein n=1 Tax=Rhizobium meliloti TaxID=382 RepID=UPI000FD845EC|nr:hypothetical protein [Sinorhizobium meliloti]RVK75447.1 hypothetical protein CN154_15195 [Sinorhizobium meliloti]
MAENALVEALEVAAGSELSYGSFERRTVSDAHLARVRRLIVRFLENVDDDLSVIDLREGLDAVRGGDQQDEEDHG